MFDIGAISPKTPVLIAGPTASGKSALALQIAQQGGGLIINADASQVFDCWRVITACPSDDDLGRAEHKLYRYIAYDQAYSTGHWLRDVVPLLNGGPRPIIVGGTGLNFTALTKGLADIPATPDEVRQAANKVPLDEMIASLDADTASRLDLANRARVQRAYEVQTATGKSLAAWQDQTPPPALPLADCAALIVNPPKEQLEARIAQRFDAMLAAGALDEIEAMRARCDPSLMSCRAIGVPELMGYVTGAHTLDQARELARIATRQYAKRQRTWIRSQMSAWETVTPASN